MSKPVREKAFVIAWPGSGLPKTSQLRTSQGARTATATSPGTATARTTAPRPRPRRTANATRAQARPTQTASFRARAATPMASPRPTRRGSRSRSRRPAGQPDHEEAGDERREPEGDGGVEERRGKHERQPDRPDQAGAQGQRPSPLGRQRPLLGEVERDAPRRRPGRGRPGPPGRSWSSGMPWSRRPASAGRRGGSGAGSQISKAGRGKKKPKAPVTGSRAGVA